LTASTHEIPGPATEQIQKIHTIAGRAQDGEANAKRPEAAVVSEGLREYRRENRTADCQAVSTMVLWRERPGHAADQEPHFDGIGQLIGPEN
jgi:hypothetical protein